MIHHMVFFNLKPEVEDADREWLFGQMQGLSKIPSVKRLAVGRLLDAREEWYKARVATDFGWVLTVEFADEDGLYAYQKDPYHLALVPEIRNRVSGTKVVDFVSPAHQL